jgi:hypothetical protein
VRDGKAILRITTGLQGVQEVLSAIRYPDILSRRGCLIGLYFYGRVQSACFSFELEGHDCCGGNRARICTRSRTRNGTGTHLRGYRLFFALTNSLNGNSHGSSRVGSTAVRNRIGEAVSARVGGHGRIGHAGGGEGHSPVSTLGNSSDSQRVAIGVAVIGQDRNGDGLPNNYGGGIGVGHRRMVDD